MHAIWSHQCPRHFPEAYGILSWELHLQYCIIYLDDIIIFSKAPKEHLHCLRLVFKKISEAGLKLKPSKCEFFKTRLEYLGHIVSEQGIETNPKKVQVIWDRP